MGEALHFVQQENGVPERLFFHEQFVPVSENRMEYLEERGEYDIALPGIHEESRFVIRIVFSFVETVLREMVVLKN